MCACLHVCLIVTKLVQTDKKNLDFCCPQIWFQNRRRKDVVTKVTTKTDDKESNSTQSICSVDNDGESESSSTIGEAISTSSTIGEASGRDSVTEISLHGDSVTERSLHGDSLAEISLHGDSVTERSLHGDSVTERSLHEDSPIGYENPGSHVSNDSNSSSFTTEQGGQSDNADKSNSLMVSPVVLRSMITELNKFDNEYLKLKKSRKKRSRPSRNASITQSQAQAAISANTNQRLFQRYDMVAPPNKVTPTAFLNTSANKFKHAGGTSAFENPREIKGFPAGLNDILSIYPGLTGQSIMESASLMQQRKAMDLSSNPLGNSSLNLPSQTHAQSGLANLLHNAAVSAASHTFPHQPSLYDNLPVLTDLLGSYKTHQSNMAAVMAQRQLEHSLMSHSQTGTLSHSGISSSNLFGLTSNNGPGSVGSSSSSSVSGDSVKSPASDVTFSSSPPQPSYPLHSHHPSPFSRHHVFPFPLIADPPSMLSSLRQQAEQFRHHTQWSTGNSPLRTQTSAPSLHGLSPPGPQSSTEDPFKPLLISSLSNPYFSPPSSTYSLPPSSALTSHPLSWPNPLMGDPTHSSYTQL